jgi:hypothetical protein
MSKESAEKHLQVTNSGMLREIMNYSSDCVRSLMRLKTVTYKQIVESDSVAWRSLLMRDNLLLTLLSPSEILEQASYVREIRNSELSSMYLAIISSSCINNSIVDTDATADGVKSAITPDGFSENISEIANELATSGALKLHTLITLSQAFDLVPLRARIMSAMEIADRPIMSLTPLVEAMAHIDSELFNLVIRRYYRFINPEQLLQRWCWCDQPESVRRDIYRHLIELLRWIPTAKPGSDPGQADAFEMIAELRNDAKRMERIAIAARDIAETTFTDIELAVALHDLAPFTSIVMVASQAYADGRIRRIQDVMPLGILDALESKNLCSQKLNTTLQFLLTRAAEIDSATIDMILNRCIDVRGMLSSILMTHPAAAMKYLHKFTIIRTILYEGSMRSLQSVGVTRKMLLQKIVTLTIKRYDSIIIDKLSQEIVALHGKGELEAQTVSPSVLVLMVSKMGEACLPMWRDHTHLVRQAVVGGALSVVYRSLNDEKNHTGYLEAASTTRFLRIAIRETLPPTLALVHLAWCYTGIGLNRDDMCAVMLSASSDANLLFKSVNFCSVKPVSPKNDLVAFTMLVERRLVTMRTGDDEPIELPWVTKPDWQLFVDAVLSHSRPVRVVNAGAADNDQPNDIGGPRLEYYRLLAASITDRFFVRRDGLLLPRTDMQISDAENIGAFMHRCIFIDKVVPELIMHPAFIARIVLWHQTPKYSWRTLSLLIGDSDMKMLSPRAHYTKSTHDLLEDITLRYGEHFRITDIIGEKLLDSTPDFANGYRFLKNSLSGTDINLEMVMRCLVIQDVNGNPADPEQYSAVRQVLESKAAEWLQSLWRFWFGSQQLSELDQCRLHYTISNSNDAMNVAVSHTCINQLDIPMMRARMSISDTVVWIECMIQRSLDGQATFETADLFYQIA